MTPETGTVLAMAAVAFLLRGAALVRGRRDRAAIADAPLLERLVRRPSAVVAWGRALLLAAGVAALVGAFRGGRTDAPSAPVEAERETVLVLDASNSMLARDVEPSRLERQRTLARHLASHLPGQVGIVFFAGRGYVLSPLTTDRDATLMYVEAVDPSAVGRGGTTLALGLEQALDLLAGGKAGARRAVVLISDGESTGEENLLAPLLSRAARAQVPVYTIGVGTRSGARIPLPDGSEAPRRPGARAAREGERFLRDPAGQVVVTRLEEEALRTISRATGGLFLPGTMPGAERLLRELAVGAKDDRPVGAGLPADPLILLAFLLLWAEGFLFRRG
ncbi:MAG: VWA domain-containing protein [Gemmatimonadota bacterium]